MSNDAVLTQILSQIQALQVSQQTLAAKVDALAGGGPTTTASSTSAIAIPQTTSSDSIDVPIATSLCTSPPAGTTLATDKEREKALYPGRVLLTTYPDQHGIQPYVLHWFAKDPLVRGPVICSRLPSSIKFRNTLGAHSGSYSIYRALAIGIGTLSPSHRPDYSMTAPPVDIQPYLEYHFGRWYSSFTHLFIHLLHVPASYLKTAGTSPSPSTSRPTSRSLSVWPLGIEICGNSRFVSLLSPAFLFVAPSPRAASQPPQRPLILPLSIHQLPFRCHQYVQHDSRRNTIDSSPAQRGQGDSTLSPSSTLQHRPPTAFATP
ncbi:hypothetical protein D9758_016205 [Tetrapyrgos nigripes]|uniref:GTP cyclohydrolase N-terminal domain-containing protein n=1 Tax=Tetrapyrgos nigripes TaxID=182062 RepID=A0A8H5CLA8_9AGAR|nr:hypothetical protein D9758_016205 [Tetrapyrgos nigripes]